MKKVLALGAMLASLSALADDGCEASYNTFDGFSLFAGLNYSSDKNESTKDFDKGEAALLTQSLIYKKAWSNDAGNALPAAVGGSEDIKNAYAFIVSNLRDGDGHALCPAYIPAFDAKGKPVFDKGAQALVSPELSNAKALLGYTFKKAVRVKESKNMRNLGGLVGASYRFAPTCAPEWLFGVNFDLVVRGKGKRAQAFGGKKLNEKLLKGVGCTVLKFKDESDYKDSFLSCNNIVDAVDGLSKDVNRWLSFDEGGCFVEDDGGNRTVAGEGIDKLGVFDVIYDYSENDKLSNPEKDKLAALFGLTANDIGRLGGDDKDESGVDISKSVYILDHLGRSNLKREVERSCVIPSLDLSVGRRFANGRFLIEGFAGITFVNAKAKIYDITNGSCVMNQKVNRIAPSVGLNFAYAVNESVSTGLKGRYIFNAKKNGMKISSNYNVSAYVAWHPKVAIAD